MSLLVIPAALALDAVLGEPKKFHPLLGFGWMAIRLERLRPLGSTSFAGVVYWCVLTLPLTYLVYVTQDLLIVNVLVLYLAIGFQSLREHAMRVYTALADGDLALAREHCGFMVSRDTTTLDENAVSKATIESVLENGSDGVTAPLFWFAVAGAPGAMIYRLSNTLDAMWGYRTDRFRTLGCFSARMDDLLNWLPARLTSIAYALCGRCRDSFSCWSEQASYYASPNAGPVMASGAGALNVCLGGEYTHNGKTKMRKTLGVGAAASEVDILRSLHLLSKAVIWFAIVMMLVQWFLGI